MNKFFSISEISTIDPVQKDKSENLPFQFTEIEDHKVHNLSELMNRLPKPGEAFFIWTVNSFNAFNFIPYILKTSPIEELVISTYSINIRIIDSISHYLHQNLIKSVYVLISDSAKYRIPKVTDHLDQFSTLNPSRVNVRYAWNHSKVTLIKTTSGFFIIEGSGNFSENSRHEQYIIVNSQKIYDFRRRWITHEIHGRTT